MVQAHRSISVREAGGPASYGMRLALRRDEQLPGMIGRAPAMQQLGALVRRVAALGVPALIRGESGSGKELVARAIHVLSPKCTGPFVAINAATLEGDLAASALFGHTRGAFTGAAHDRQGAFRRADGGTLFIDEIGSLPLKVQGALLRVVEEGAVRPLGADRVVTANVRIVAATCEPLEGMVQRATFRADLYQRLSVCVIRVPSLRERPGDVALLAEHLVDTLGLGKLHIEDAALALLETYTFPGNVRELRNLLMQAAIVGDGEVVRKTDVAAAFEVRAAPRPRITPEEALDFLRASAGNISAAARRAGLPRSTYRDVLKRRK